MLTVAQFLQLESASLAVYGIDGGAIATDIYLRKLGLHDRLVGFISDTPDAPAKFCGKPVLSATALDTNPDIAIITANLNFTAVHDRLRQAGITNAFYYHASFWPWLDDEAEKTDYFLLRGHYRKDDDHTTRLLENILQLRTNSGICRIQPYTAVKDIFYALDTYWLESRSLADASLTVIDTGAFDGDTLQSLLNSYGQRIKRYYAFEPAPHIFPKLRQTAKALAGITRVECFNIAIGHTNSPVVFKAGSSRNSRLAHKGGMQVDCRRLDDLSLDIVGKACLKMDIEGMELEALAGAATFIKTHKPHLALCLYHKANDIHKIPQYVKTLVPEYEFTLAGGVHTLCYGRVKAGS